MPVPITQYSQEFGTTDFEHCSDGLTHRYVYSRPLGEEGVYRCERCALRVTKTALKKVTE